MPKPDLPHPDDELALRLLERWVSVVHADTTRSFLHAARRKPTDAQLVATERVLESVADDHALDELIERGAPRWQARLIVAAVVDFVGALADLPKNDSHRADAQRLLDGKAPLSKLGALAVKFLASRTPPGSPSK
jgi:hypothetical protein